MSSQFNVSFVIMSPSSPTKFPPTCTETLLRVRIRDDRYADPSSVLASMGNYVFEAEFLLDLVQSDAENSSSKHDIGGDLIPASVSAGRAHVYDFAGNTVPGDSDRDRGYWRDVGTIDAYFDAHMDLVRPEPVFNLYNQQWPIYTASQNAPPAKIVAEEGRVPVVENSMLSAGAIVSGSNVIESVLSRRVHVEGGSTIERCIILDDVRVGKGSVIRNAVIDKNVVVPPGTTIGVDRGRDAARFAISQGGIVTIGKKDTIIEPN